MQKKKVIGLLLALFSMAGSAAALPLREEGQKFAAYLTVIAIMISLPAFISLYFNIRKTNLGQLLFQPLLAMFIGFFGIMLNSLVDIWKILNGYSVDNISVVMGVNRALSSVLIAGGCVVLFFNVKHRGLFSLGYYQKKKLKMAKSKGHKS